MSSVKNRLAATLAASAVLLGSVAALGSSPASAAPGDASARGVGVGLTVNLLGQPAIGLNSGLGSVVAPPNQAVSLVDASIGVPATAAVTAGVVNVEATSSPSLADGEAEVTGATVSVPAVDALIGGPILGTGTSVIRASAGCASGNVPTTSFGDTATLVVAGQPVVLDANGEATVNVATLLNVPVGTVSIRTDVSNVGAETAEAVAVLVDIDLNVIGVASVNGQVRIAEASCERRAVNESPSIVSIDPDTGPVAGGQTVTITGTNFVAGDTKVIVDGVAVPAGDITVVSPTELTYLSPAHAAGTVDVYVITPISSSTTLDYTYVDDGTGDAPFIDSIAPDEGPIAGGTAVVLTGGRFVPGETTITIGGIEIPAGDVEVDSDGVTATFTTPPHAAGPVEVTATTGAGTSSPQTFTYIDDSGSEAPVAETIDPAEGPVEGGTVVVIDGSGFVPGETTVTIDGQTIPADEVTVNDEGTTVTFTTPPHVAGPVDVVVTTPNGDSGVLVFTYVEGDTGGPSDPLYDNCDEVFAAGLSDLTPSDPGYGTHLDRDGDGVACEATGNGGPGGPGDGGNNGNSNNGSLPRTGAESVPLVAGGLLTVLVGGAVLAARRRLA